MQLNHLHIKSQDPGNSASWWAEAFGFEIVADETRPTGDRFLRCTSANGIPVYISGTRDGETLAAARPVPAFGLEHFGFHTDDLEADRARLIALGAVPDGSPERLANGKLIAFLVTPDGVRVELIEPAR
jgi:catechol 2,3-dioxygenase-like lactoylglutathione lyase family enzyme